MGSKLILKPFFLDGIPITVFSEDQRIEPIELAGVSGIISQTVTMLIPTVMTLVENIADKAMKTDFGLYSITSESGENSMILRKNYQVSDRLLPGNRYGDVVQFFKYVANSERIVMIFEIQDGQ